MKKGLFLTVLTIVEIALIIFGINYFINGNNMFGIIFLVISFVLLLFVIINYNKMIKYKNKIKEAFALVDIQLKLRFDLIPNLVKVVKGYNKHEKEVITEITKLRKLALSATDEKEKLDYANQILPKLRNLIAVAESYPEIKSSVLYKDLMLQLVDVEDRLVAARRIYDSNVNIYNTTIEVFPNNILANVFGFKREELFKIDAGENIKFTIE